MRGRYGRKDPMDTIFKIFPYIFGVVFVLILTVVIAQFAFVGYLGYKAVTDPEGSAKFIGNIAAEVVRPSAEAIKGE